MGEAYKKAGVDYDVIDEFKRRAQELARSTDGNIDDTIWKTVPESRGESVFLLEGMDSYLAIVAEQLGTKNLVADAVYEQTGKSFYYNVGIDTAASIINDLATAGARPLALAQMPLAGDSEWFKGERAADFLAGWTEACNRSRAVYGPGESPALPGLVAPETAVLTGASIGIIDPKDRYIESNIDAGDQIVLLESTGIHANGSSLARSLAERLPDGYQTELSNGRPYGEALLDASHIYSPVVQECLHKDLDIFYAPHLTGHGWTKLMRSRSQVRYVIEKLPPVPPVLEFIVEQTGMDSREAYQTLNMGAGFALFVQRSDVADVIEIASKNGIAAYHAGQVEQRSEESTVEIKPLGITYTAKDLTVR